MNNQKKEKVSLKRNGHSCIFKSLHPTWALEKELEREREKETVREKKWSDLWNGSSNISYQVPMLFLIFVSWNLSHKEHTTWLSFTIYLVIWNVFLYVEYIKSYASKVWLPMVWIYLALLTCLIFPINIWSYKILCRNVLYSLWTCQVNKCNKFVL